MAIVIQFRRNCIGDSSRAPTWVPSPVMAYGGPVAVAARAGQPQTFQVCSLLKPAINGVSVSGPSQREA
eukprot:4794460-Amphidinium_carterae.1